MEEDKRKEKEHCHHPECGHIAVAHIGEVDWMTHIGFLVDGELECFLPNIDHHDSGNDSNNCCGTSCSDGKKDCCSAGTNKGAKNETSEPKMPPVSDTCCSNTTASCCGHNHSEPVLPMIPVHEKSKSADSSSSSDADEKNKRCKVPLPPVRDCCVENPCDKHIISCGGDHHNTLLTIKHSDHVDYLVEDGKGNYVLHHNISGGSCIDHGKLLQVPFAHKDDHLDVHIESPLLHENEKKNDHEVDHFNDDAFESLRKHWLSSLFVASISDHFMPWRSELATRTSSHHHDLQLQSLDNPDHGHSHEKNHHGQPHQDEKPQESQFTKSTTDIESNPKMATTKIHIAGMCCTAEVPMVERVLLESMGVQKQNGIAINLVMRDVVVKYDPLLCTPQQLVDSLNAARLDASLKAMPTKPVLLTKDAGNVASVINPSSAVTTKKKTFWSTLPPWYVLLGLLLWLLSFLTFVKNPPEMESFKWLSVAACILCIPRILLKCVATLRRRMLDVNCLMVIAVIGALALQDFEEAAAVVVIFSLANWLEDRASSKARESLEKIIEMKPEFAIIQSGNDSSIENQRVVPVDDVEIGDICAVRAGDKVPVDGIIINGHGLIDESNLTGESVPVEKKMNDNVHAGTINVGNSLLILKATAISENSAVARLVKLVQESQSQRSPTEQLVEKVAAIYTPVVVLVALLLGTIPFAWGNEKGMEYLKIALTLLVVACPCAFVISTPLTYVCGIAAAAKNGVVVKGGKHLETAAQVNILGMDKTGTLTKGVFEIIGFHLVDIPPSVINSEFSNVNTSNTKKQEVTLHIPKVCCKKEAKMITDILEKVPDITAVMVDVKAKQVTVSLTNTHTILQQVRDALETGGFESSIVTNVLKVDNSVMSRYEIMEIVRVCEENSTHPLANALRQHADKEILSKKSLIQIKNLDILPGEGIKCELMDGRIAYVGSSKILNRLPSINPKPATTIISDLNNKDGKITLPEALYWGSVQEATVGATVGWVIVGNKIRAIFAAADSVRPEAPSALKKLKDMMIELVMLTGDNNGSATRVANAISNGSTAPIFADIHSSLKPEEKVYWIKKLEQNEGKNSVHKCCSKSKKKSIVAMIGDGVNDSPSLAAANISIAMGAAGSPIAIETADIALMDSDLEKISWFFKLSRSTRNKILENISFSIVVKVITIILSILGYVGLGAAIGIDVVNMLLVTLNSVDLLRKYKNSASIPVVSAGSAAIAQKSNKSMIDNAANV